MGCLLGTVNVQGGQEGNKTCPLVSRREGKIASWVVWVVKVALESCSIIDNIGTLILCTNVIFSVISS